MISEVGRSGRNETHLPSLWPLRTGIWSVSHLINRVKIETLPDSYGNDELISDSLCTKVKCAHPKRRAIRKARKRTLRSRR